MYLYHRMTREEMANFKGCLEVLTSQWHTQCLNHQYSAGYVLEVTGGPCGKGLLLMSAMNIGPFIYTL